MEITKNKPHNTGKNKFGGFELKPEEGWEISETFLDFESKLLIVSVYLEDESKWINNSYNGKTIPSKEYKIDLKTLKILEPEEWKKYFNYNKFEIISDDKRYKLISERVFDPEQGRDEYREELYDLHSGELISSGTSIAFSENKRENLLESFYRSQADKKEEERILGSKPTLGQFYQIQMASLENNDAVLCYYDHDNVYKLTYLNNKFILSKSGQLPSDLTIEESMTFDFAKSFNTIDDFWVYFTTEKKWYLEFNYLNKHGLFSTKALLLAKHIISFFNDLRKEHNFMYNEYNKINNWSNLVWSEDYKRTELKQWCSNCFKEVYYQARYPKYICNDCASKNKTDREGNQLEFSNLGLSGGFKITYKDGKGNTIREDDTQEYCDCIIDDKMFFAQEARFGGIVIQRKE